MKLNLPNLQVSATRCCHSKFCSSRDPTSENRSRVPSKPKNLSIGIRFHQRCGWFPTRLKVELHELRYCFRVGTAPAVPSSEKKLICSVLSHLAGLTCCRWFDNRFHSKVKRAVTAAKIHIEEQAWMFWMTCYRVLVEFVRHVCEVQVSFIEVWMCKCHRIEWRILCEKLGILKNVSLMVPWSSHPKIDSTTLTYIFTLKCSETLCYYVAIRNGLNYSLQECFWNRLSLEMFLHFFFVLVLDLSSICLNTLLCSRH